MRLISLWLFKLKYTYLLLIHTYLHHLHKAGEILGAQLNTIHNLYYYQILMAEMREAIEQGKFTEFQTQFHSNRARGIA